MRVFDPTQTGSARPTGKTRQMAIQWFPGHMNVTKKAIIDRIKDTDVVIEMLDARLPGSSSNPLLSQLTGHRARLKILNKQDLADPNRTDAWLAWYNAQPSTRALALDAGEKAPAQRLIQVPARPPAQRFVGGGAVQPQDASLVAHGFRVVDHACRLVPERREAKGKAGCRPGVRAFSFPGPDGLYTGLLCPIPSHRSILPAACCSDRSSCC